MVKFRNLQQKSSNGPWYVALSTIVCSAIWLDYWGYSAAQYRDPGAWLQLIHGQGAAPEQYRIGVLWVSFRMSHFFHVAMRHAFTGIDLVTCALAVFVLYRLLQSELEEAGVSRAERLFCNAGFAALTAFFLSWIEWYQRPETLPSLFFVAATLGLVARPPKGRAGRLCAAFFMIVLAAAQGWVRADVACLMHAGIILACFLPGRPGFAQGRWQQAIVSAMAALAAGATQLYIMHCLYPHAVYGKTRVMQVFSNLSTPTEYAPFLLFMLPVAVLWVAAARDFSTISTAGRMMVLSSALYFLAWFAVGRIEEVRIFLPFAMALSPWMLIRTLKYLDLNVPAEEGFSG